MTSSKKLKIGNKTIKLPVFFPDATRAVVRSVDSRDLKDAGIEAVVINTLHLAHMPGSAYLETVGGCSQYMGWDGVVMSDSGGFQVFSMIQKAKTKGRITEDGIEYAGTWGGSRKVHTLTPERSIEIQFALAADIMVTLDYFSPPYGTTADIERSVRMTSEWAQRSKNEWERQIKIRKMKFKPKLIAPIQGGFDKSLREKSATSLINIGFDGYGFGGWPMDKNGKFDMNIFTYTASLMPTSSIKFALGVGKPSQIVAGYIAGYDMFDCVLPTRDARHGRIYAFTDNDGVIDFKQPEKSFKTMIITKNIYSEDRLPLSPNCDCSTCASYSRSYINHLFKIGDTLAYRLSTIHNLRTYTRVTDMLRTVNREE